LDMKNNYLLDRGVPKRVFKPLRNLEKLILSNNLLETVPRYLPAKLEILDLSDNKIKIVDSFYRLRRLSKRNLQFIPNYNEIYIGSNKTTTNNLQQSSTFRHHKHVVGLYLKGNKISNVGLGKKSFTGLNNVEFIDLSHNNLTSIPDNLPDKISRLQLERNNLKNITFNSTKKLKSLNILVIHHNQLMNEGIENGSLFVMNNLETIRMETNKLKEIPKNLPNKLRELILFNNRISHLYKDDFNTTRKLEILNLAYNNLTNSRMYPGVLRKLTKVVDLDLRGNSFTAIPTVPDNVEMLMLGENLIHRISRRSISRLHKLRYLTLNDNQLKDDCFQGGRTFSQKNTITSLDLRGNQLTRIPLSLPPLLKSIYLQDNMITNVQKIDFRKTPYLKEVFLQDNCILPTFATEIRLFPSFGDFKSFEMDKYESDHMRQKCGGRHLAVKQYRVG